MCKMCEGITQPRYHMVKDWTVCSDLLLGNRAEQNNDKYIFDRVHPF